MTQKYATKVTKSFKGSLLNIDGTKISTNIQNVLDTYGDKLLKDLQKRSAYDPKSNDHFRDAWVIRKHAMHNGRVELTIVNNQKYSRILIEGAEKNSAPWYYNQNKKNRTGKLFVSGGKVWAGGQNPGKRLAAGGAKSGLASSKTFRNNLIKDCTNVFLSEIS